MWAYLLASLFLMSLPACAQQSLTRISSTERADQLGYVVRFHMENPADSFRVWQPDNQLIQLRIYKQDIDVDRIQVFDPVSPFRFVELHPLHDGVGVDIHLEEGHYFMARAYPDANGKDLLTGLTSISNREASVLTAGLNPIAWNIDDAAGTPSDTGDSLLFDPGEIDDDEIQRAMELYDFENFGSESLKFEVVVIDAGHGGIDPGAVGYGGVYEKDITLAVALRLGSYIEEFLPDLKVVYTRTDDTFVGLQERGQIANEARGDLFISLHANSNSNTHAQGTEVYFLGMHRSRDAFEVMKRENAVIRFEEEDERIEELSEGQLLIYELANIGNISSSEVFAGLTDHQFRDRARRRSRGVKQAGFMVLYHASMPAILVELGFITNPQEQRFLTSEYGQSIMASAIFRAVRDYKEKIDRSQGNNNRMAD